MYILMLCLFSNVFIQSDIQYRDGGILTCDLLIYSHMLCHRAKPFPKWERFSERMK